MTDVLALRVAARFQRKIAAWEGKLVGKEWRLTWSMRSWKLEELPAKGKRKLRVCTMQNHTDLGWLPSTSAFIPENILHEGHVSTGDTFEAVKEKIQVAMGKAGQENVLKLKKPLDHGDEWLTNPRWNEDLVYFLEVMPEGVEPFTVEGKDYTVSVEWGKFEAYDPKADLQNHDPSYTKYESSSPQAARKMYQTLRANPDSLKSVDWNKFDEWMKANKIGYKIHFSQWR